MGIHRLLAVVGVALTLLVGYWVEHAPNLGADTPFLVQGSGVALRCLEQGKLSNCGKQRGLVQPFPRSTSVGPYPLLQYVPSTALKALGASDAQVLTGLALINVAAFLLLLFLLWRTMRSREEALGLGLALLLIGSPLLWYANSTFGETLSAFVLVLFCATLLARRHPLLVAGATWFACLTKETAMPFVVAMGLIALYGAGSRSARASKQLLGLVIGGALGLASTALFNVFRFGTLSNRDYLQPFLKTPTLKLKAELLGAQIAAPNGGLIAFWGPALLVIILAGTFAVRALLRRQPARRWWPGLALAGLFAALLIGLAHWFAPFGGDTWGPRLILPWIPALLLLTACVYQRELRAWLHRVVHSQAGFLATGVVVCAVSLPQVGVLWQPTANTSLFTHDGVNCRPLAPLGSRAYYRCFHHRAWERRPVLLAALRGLTSPPGLLFGLSLVMANFALLELIRTSPSSRQRTGRHPRQGTEVIQGEPG